MPFTLKTTGLAAIATSIIAVDEDGTTIRDFKSATRTANMSVHADVVRGSSNWKGTSRRYFETLPDGTYGFKGVTIAAGHEIPFENHAGAPGTGTFVAYAGMAAAGGIQTIFGGANGDPVLLRTSGKLDFHYAGNPALTTLPTDNTTKFSIGANFLYGSDRDFFYGLESADDMAVDGEYAEGGYGNSRLINTIGGVAGQGNSPGKFHVIVTVPRPITLAEYQSLHDDWFSTLFETSAPDTTVPVLTGSITASSITHNSFKLDWSAGSDNVAVTGYEYSLNGGTSWIDAGNVLTVTPTGLTASTAYPVQVRDYDAAGNRSTPPLTATVTTVAAPSDTTTPTLAGSITFSNVTSSGFKIDWPAGSDNVGVAGYEVSVVAGAGADAYVNVGNVLTITETGKAASTDYTVKVRDYDAAGNRSAPLTGTVTTAAASGTTGTITSDAFRNWSGTLLVGLTVENVVVLTLNRAIALALTNQVTNGEGKVVIANNAALVSGTDYMLASFNPDGTIRGFKKVRAT